jgi:hypothetical protein
MAMRGVARVALAAGVAAAAACGDGAAGVDAAIDAAPSRPAVGVPSVLEAADCGGAAMVPRSGAPLVVSSLRVLYLPEGIDLDGDQTSDNQLGRLADSSLQIAAALRAGTLAIPLELFDRGADPDACMKLALYRGACAAAPCDFTDDDPDTLSLDASSIAGGTAVSRLRALGSAADGAVSLAGPGYLELAFPLPFGDDPSRPVDDFVLPLTTSHASGVLVPTGTSRLRVAGVLQAFRLGQLPAPVHGVLDTSPGDSELDAIFANVLGRLLGLRQSPEGCLRADVDVDGDGLEAFCDVDDGLHRVGICIDGDGVALHDGDNGIADCSQAMKHGRPRFVDGISAQLELTARPAVFTP